MTHVRRRTNRRMAYRVAAGISGLMALAVMVAPSVSASLAILTSSDAATVKATALTPYSGAVMADNPIAYWRLDEPSGTVAKDSIAGRDGTYVSDTGGTAAPGTAAWVKNGSTAATTSGGQVRSPVGLPIPTTVGSQVTVDFWMHLPASAETGMVFSFLNRNTLYFYRGRFGFNTLAGDLYSTTMLDLVNRPVHVAAVFNNATTASDYQSAHKLYIDGVQRPLTMAYTPNIYPLGNQVALSGTSPEAADTSLRLPAGSKVSDLAIYNGELPAARVKAHYDAAAVPPPAAPTEKLLGYWRMDDSLSPTTPAMDGTTNNNNGQYIADAGGTYNLSFAPIQKGVAAAPSFDGGTMRVTGVPVPTAPGAKVTVEFWMQVPVAPSGMIFAFDDNALWLDGSNIAFNTLNADQWGTSSAGLFGRPVFVSAVFSNDSTVADYQANHKLYIDGVAKPMSMIAGTPLLKPLTGSIATPGFPGGTGYRMPTGTRVSGVAIYEGELSASVIAQHYNNTK